MKPSEVTSYFKGVVLENYLYTHTKKRVRNKELKSFEKKNKNEWFKSNRKFASASFKIKSYYINL